jgi:hypothetical protein
MTCLAQGKLMAGVQLPSIDLAFGFDFLRERSLSVDAGLGRVGTSATGPFASADTSRRLQPGWGHWQTTRQGITDASPASASAPRRIDDLDVSRGVGLLGSASLRILSMIPFQTGAAECGVRLRTDQDWCSRSREAGDGTLLPTLATKARFLLCNGAPSASCPVQPTTVQEVQFLCARRRSPRSHAAS